MLTQFSTDWLTDWLMLSDKHDNLRTARARNLISLLINVALSQDAPFQQTQQLQFLHHGATIETLCDPIFSSQLRIRRWRFAASVMASVQDTNIAEILITAIMSSTLLKSRHHGIHASRCGACTSHVFKKVNKQI